MRILVRGGRVVDPDSGIDATADVYVSAGKIAAIGERPEGFEPNRVIEAGGWVVAPGLVDLSARLREPGSEYRATLDSELHAAAAGGITRLVCPPDTDPPLDEPGLVEMLKYRERSLNLCHVHPLGALTVGLAGKRLTEMAALHAAGCVGFSQANVPLEDTLVLARALDYAATFGFSVWIQPQDGFMSRGGVAHDGEVATRLGLPAIPVCAETIALSTVLHLVRRSRTRVHFCRLSSAEGVDLVRAARREGLPVTCDVDVNHLHLSEMDVDWFDSAARLTPPLRATRDRDALRAAVADGTIDAICSDHTPLDDDEKQVPFAEAAPGATGLELLLPLALKFGREHQLTLSRTLDLVTRQPAKVAGLDAGRIKVGQPADLCLFDPDAAWMVDRHALRSQGKSSPFEGREMVGRVAATLVGGHVVYDAARG